MLKALVNLYKRFIKAPKYLIIHHSASSKITTVEEIRQWHLQKGWIDIAYHKLIDFKGNVYQGRPDAVIGAQAFGANEFSLGICCIGNYEKEEPTLAMRRSLIQTCATLCKRYNIPAENIIGHRDVANKFNITNSAAKTSCPGDKLYAKLPEVRNAVSKYL